MCLLGRKLKKGFIKAKSMMTGKADLLLIRDTFTDKSVIGKL